MNALRKYILCLTAFIIIFSMTALANTPYITMNTWDEAYYEHASITGIDQYTGNVLWNTYLGTAPMTEASSGTYLGIHNGFAYAVFDGSVFILDPQTGTVLIKNSDFGGSCSAYTFSSSGKLYMSGWDGPDFYILNTDGTTLSRVNSIKNQYYWPESLHFSSGNNIVLTYGLNSYDEGHYPVEFDVTKYFGIIEY